MVEKIEGLDKELERLSEESGISVEDITKELDTLISEKNFDTESALAVWKSEHSGMLGGKTADVVARCISVGQPRSVELKDGSTSEVANAVFFAGVDGKVELRNVTFWGERVAMLSSFAKDSVYAFKAKLLEQPGKDGVLPMRLVGETGSISEHSGEFPAMTELIQNHGIVSAAEIENYVGATGFFSGIVGDIPEGDRTPAFKMSAMGSNPVTIWSDEAIEVSVGDKVTVFGFVSSKDGNVSINRVHVYKA